MFNNLIFITDADGTLLTDGKRILDKDLAAINEFVSGGGLFTLATGRGVMLTRPLAAALPMSLPAVIFNGAAVYDFNEDKFLWQCVLPQSAHIYARMFKERYPSVAIEILIHDDVYVTSTNAREEDHIFYGGGVPIRCAPSDVPDTDWIKILLVDEPDTIDDIIAYAKTAGLHGVHTVRSSPYYYEILPEGVNKGGGFKKMLEICGIKDKKIIAAGDYMNDTEMLEAADFAVAAANAEDEVKAAAHYIACDNNSGIAADIIARVKQGISFDGAKRSPIQIL